MADANTNGKPAQKQELQRPMKESRRSIMEAGLRAYHETAQEMEELKAQIDRLNLDLKAKDMEIASLNERIHTMRDDHASVVTNYESRIVTADAQRSEAIAEAVVLKTVLVGVAKSLETAGISRDTALKPRPAQSDQHDED
jgi:chromosome segregation ATPase